MKLVSELAANHLPVSSKMSLTRIHRSFLGAKLFRVFREKRALADVRVASGNLVVQLIWGIGCINRGYGASRKR